VRQDKNLIDVLSPLEIGPNWAMKSSYTIPDNMVSTDFFVYFDFLRGVTRKSGSGVVDKDSSKELFSEWIKGFKKYLQVFATNKCYKLMMAAGEADSLTVDQMQHLMNMVLNGFVSGVTVTSQRSGPSTASIDLSPHMFRGSATIPKTYNDPILFKMLGSNPDIFLQLLTPHTYVYIYAGGRVFSKRYFPIFHGLINEVELKNDKGIESVSVECEDVSKLLRLAHANISPAIVDVKTPKEMASRNPNFWGEAFREEEADQIVAKMICGSNPVAVSDRESIQADRVQIYFNDANAQDGVAGIGILDYMLFKNSANIYDELWRSTILKNDWNAFPLEKMRGNRLFVPWGVKSSPYRQIKSPNLPMWDSGLELKLDVCRAVKTKMYGEFYADPMGNFWFHPMRLGADFITAPIIENHIKHQDVISKAGVYVIDQDEIITTSRSFNDDGICTHLGFSGVYKLFGQQDVNFDLQLGLGAPISMRERYGMRYQTHTEELINDRDLLKIASFAHIQLKNADLYNCGVTIPLRPELQIARPVLLLDRGEIFYINSVSHNIRVGSIPTTNLGLTFGRSIKAQEYDFISWLIQTDQFIPMDIQEYVKKLETMAGWEFVMAGEQGKK
jgi:hypothetical protein